MATYKRQLKDKDGNTIYPDVGLELDDVIYGSDPGQVETPSPWVETGDIKDAQITGEKLDFTSSAGTAVVKTITDDIGRTGLYFADGTLITYRKIEEHISINNSWGSFYEGHNQDYYAFIPNGGTDFISSPCVQITALNRYNSGSFWLGGWEYSVQKTSDTNNKWAIPAGALCFLRPSVADNVYVDIFVQAIGKWK